MRSVSNMLLRLTMIAATVVAALALTSKDANAQMMYRAASESLQMKLTKMKLIAKDSSRFAGSSVLCRDKILDRDPKEYGYNIEEVANISMRGNDGTHVYLPASRCDKTTVFQVSGQSSDTLVMEMSKLDTTGETVFHFASVEERKAHMGEKQVNEFADANSFVCTQKKLPRLRSLVSFMRGIPVDCVAKESNPDFTGKLSFVIVQGFN